jgi:hypothetical protein
MTLKNDHVEVAAKQHLNDIASVAMASTLVDAIHGVTRNVFNNY